MLLRNQVRDPFYPECPVRNVLARIGGKWTILLLLTLEGSDKPLRFKDLRQSITDISDKMLTQTLHDLEADGLIVRIAHNEVPPRVEYTLSDRAKTLMPHLNALVDWAIVHINDIIETREAYYNVSN